MKEVLEMDDEKTLESVPSATQEKIKVESINVIVEEIGGKPYYELRYRVVGDDFCYIYDGSYCLENVLEWKKQYFEVVPHKNKQRKEMKWIPCSERLPAEDTEVLVWFEYFRYGEYNRLYQTVGISYTYNGQWTGFVNSSSGWKDLRIIAWMPLPDPYKGGVRR